MPGFHIGVTRIALGAVRSQVRPGRRM